MQAENLIIHLILQDLRHRQLLFLLEKTGMDTEIHYSDIVMVVGRLMGLPEQGISDQFVEIYTSFMEEVEPFEITGTGNHLFPLAKKCYEMLKCCIEVEKRVGGDKEEYSRVII